MIVFDSEESARGAAQAIQSNEPPDGVVTIDDVEVREVVASA
jgi:hypothetical protein